jgi:hypothetical protein
MHVMTEPFNAFLEQKIQVVAIVVAEENHLQVGLGVIELAGRSRF